MNGIAKKGKKVEESLPTIGETDKRSVIVMNHTLTTAVSAEKMMLQKKARKGVVPEINYSSKNLKK